MYENFGIQIWSFGVESESVDHKTTTTWINVLLTLFGNWVNQTVSIDDFDKMNVERLYLTNITLSYVLNAEPRGQAPCMTPTPTPEA